MGNSSGKKQCDDQYLKNLDEIFYTISNRKRFILHSDLQEGWSSQIDKNLYSVIETYLFLENQFELSNNTFKKFYFDICKGNSETKTEIFCKLLGCTDKISGGKILQFITSILNSILLIQESKSPKRYNLWSGRIVKKEKGASIKEFAKFFLNQIQKTENDEFTKTDLQSLLIHLDFYLYMVLSRLYETEDKNFYTSVIPKWKYMAVDAGINLEELSELDLFTVIFLNLQLPVDFQNEWRILFSTTVHGESFSRLTAEIINRGPTIIIVKDKDDYVFGGFAPCNWALGPTFCGDSRSFLFTLYPKMNVYLATNFNENYQYLNVGQQTMPNGLGMGGRLEYFALWINAEFGTGYCSESCTTFRNYKMMSGSKDFEITHLEVWGVGSPPSTEADLGERSVLDTNLEAKAILEMSGKTSYSEGLRKAPQN